MPTAHQCRTRAEEAERLARLVSYERDRTRLMRQAREWREQADRIDAEPPADPSSDPAPGMALNLRRWLGLTR